MDRLTRASGMHSSAPPVHVNLNVRGLNPSATVNINERCNELIAEGYNVFRLGLGQSPFPVPPKVVQALQRHAHEKDYLPVKGLPELRGAITEFIRRTEGLDYRSEHVLVGPGTKELMFILQLVYYGDLVIPTPSWVSYAPQARIIGRHLHWLPTRIESGLGVTPHALEALCREDPQRPRLLILNYPSNPTGMCYTRAQLEEIADVARYYRLLLLSDEIYSGLDFSGRHVSIARFYPEGTIISNGLSKWCGAGGWRLGAFIFPEHLKWLHQGMTAVASETFTSTSAPIQHAAVSAFQDDPEMDRYLDRTRRVLSALAAHVVATLEQAGAHVAPPKGGFYCFPNFDPLRSRLAARRIKTSEQLCERLLEETGVAILPGSAFGRPPSELSARIALVDFDGAEALQAADSLAPETLPDEEFLRRHCTPVMEAISRLADWL